MNFERQALENDIIDQKFQIGRFEKTHLIADDYSFFANRHSEGFKAFVDEHLQHRDHAITPMAAALVGKYRKGFKNDLIDVVAQCTNFNFV